MKKLIIVLLMFFVIALPVMAEKNISGTMTESVEYNSIGELTDSTELALTFEVDENINADIVLTVSDIISDNPFGSSLEGSIAFTDDEGGVFTIGGDVDLLTYDTGVYAKYIGLKISDKANLDSKAKIVYPANTWYAVSTLSYDIKEDILLLAEVRYDSDGAENISAEAQIKYAVNKDIDVMFGVEFNDWADGINDWDSCSIDSDVDRIYAEFVYKF